MLLRLLLCTCVPALFCTACGSSKYALPAAISEASGLVIDGEEMIWNNDSGDGPHLYTTDLQGNLLRIDTLNAMASDYEDLGMDENGLLYVGDFGNNTGRRKQMVIYSYDRATGHTDSILFTYPGQDGQGRLVPGNYDCEALVAADGQLHLFTKDMLFGERKFFIKHYRLPATPGTYEATLVDSLYLPRRVITGATLDRQRKQLVLVAYNFRMLLGFIPTSSASVITISGYPEGRFLRGKLKRRNLSWAIPTQHEAIAIYDDKYLYTGAEATRIRKHAILRRLKRKKLPPLPAADTVEQNAPTTGGSNLRP